MVFVPVRQPVAVEPSLQRVAVRAELDWAHNSQALAVCYRLISVVESSRTISNLKFPREARLLDATSYGQVFKRNRRVTNQHWIVLGHRSKTGSSRLGLAIAKKRARRAVDRNRLKRIARESFRHQRQQLHGFDVVVMNKDRATSASSVELRRSLDTLWLELSGGK